MGQHCALRHAGSAGGVDDHRHVVGLACGECLIDQRAVVGLVLVAEFEQRLERHQVVLAIVPHALHVDADKTDQIRQAALVALGVDHLVGLFLVAADDDLGPRVANDVLQFRPRVGRIDAEAGAAQHLCGHVGVEPFRRVLACDGQPVASTEAQRIEADGTAARVDEVLPPGRLLPDATNLLAQCKLAGMRVGAALQHLRHAERGECCGREVERGHAADLRAPR
jgi:hypothetical protein